MRSMHRALFMLLLVPCSLHSQESRPPLDIFGYFQAVFDQANEQTSMFGGPMESTQKNTFMLQQANIFLRKEFTSKVTSFVNLEFTNSYSSAQGWGTFRIEEGWVWYEPVEAFSIKAGLLVPVFNNLNEIKNRMPLLPYIIRPIVYEAAAEGLTSLEEIVPQSAFLQLQGTIPVDVVKFDYAVYAGNGDPLFTTSNNATDRYIISGTDTTTFKLIGGRVGARWGRLKAGFSLASDKVNRVSYGIGAVSRIRMGGDLSFQSGSLSLESEYIFTKEHLNTEQKRTWDVLSSMNPMLGIAPENEFAYGVVTYDLMEAVYAYVGAEYFRSHLNSITRGYMVGGGYRPMESVVIKFGYMRIDNEDPGLAVFHSNRVQAGVSVMF